MVGGGQLSIFCLLSLFRLIYIYICMAQIPSLCLGNLQCVVVFLGGGVRCICVCGGGGCCYGVLVLGKCAGVSQRKY